MRPITVALAILEKEARPYTVVQIGSYIGDTINDHLYQHFSKPGHGRLLAIEPIREYFDMLQVNYAHCPWVKCLNLAVSDRNGIAEMYRLGVNALDYGYPEWLNQLSSLKQERMEALWDAFEGAQPGVEFDNSFYLQHRTTETVQTATLATVMQHAGLSEVDLLAIDVEGYEAEIIDQIDFPFRYLNYEYPLLGPATDVRLMIDLDAKGYSIMPFGQDKFAWKTGDVIEQVYENIREMYA